MSRSGPNQDVYIISLYDLDVETYGEREGEGEWTRNFLGVFDNPASNVWSVTWTLHASSLEVTDAEPPFPTVRLLVTDIRSSPTSFTGVNFNGRGGGRLFWGICE